MNAREDITTTAQTHGWAIDGTGSTIGMTRGVVLVEVTFSRSGQVTQALRIAGDIRTDVLTARDAGKREAVVAWLTRDPEITRHIPTGHPATLVVMSCEGSGASYSLHYAEVADAVAQLGMLTGGAYGEVRDDVTGETYTLAHGPDQDDDGIDHARVLADHPLDDDEARARCIPHDNDPSHCEGCAQVLDDVQDDTDRLAYEMFLSFDPAYHADTYSQVLVIPDSVRPVLGMALTDHAIGIAAMVTGRNVTCSTIGHDDRGARRVHICVDDDDQFGGVVTFRRV